MECFRSLQVVNPFILQASNQFRRKKSIQISTTRMETPSTKMQKMMSCHPLLICTVTKMTRTMKKQHLMMC